MPKILSRLSILFINYKSRDLDNTKILLYKLFVRYLVVKPACVNAALDMKAIANNKTQNSIKISELPIENKQNNKIALR